MTPFVEPEQYERMRNFAVMAARAAADHIDARFPALWMPQDELRRFAELIDAGKPLPALTLGMRNALERYADHEANRSLARE
jgi:hypothetical protein